MSETTKSDRDLALSVLREIAGDRSASSEARLAAVRELMECVDMREDGPAEPGPSRASDIGRHIYGALVDACHGRVELLADGSPDNPLATLEMVPDGDITLDLESAKALRKLLAVYIDEVRS